MLIAVVLPIAEVLPIVEINRDVHCTERESGPQVSRMQSSICHIHKHPLAQIHLMYSLLAAEIILETLTTETRIHSSFCSSAHSLCSFIVCQYILKYCSIKD